MIDTDLIKTLCSIPSVSGHEENMYRFLINYIDKHAESWKHQPEVIHGPDFQHCIVLSFGTPRTAVFAHIDSIGFHVRYSNQLVRIGGPKLVSGYMLAGHDSQGPVEGPLHIDEAEETISIQFGRTIDRGTPLHFKMNFRETAEYIQSCYLDNRLGVYNALKLAETLENGVIVFSCWEEHGGGSVPYITKYLWERFRVRQCLISDITWVTEGVPAGEGVAVSLRDSGIPRRSYTDRIIQILREAGVRFQLEVEGSGGSDGNEIQKQPYPIDWCFIGAPEDYVHSPDERVHKRDLSDMLHAYRVLMNVL
jgi:putative aminopeptidase FrvX